MIIGNIEIRILRRYQAAALNYQLPDVDLRMALAVPDTDGQWRAVHQIINVAEAEALREARMTVANERMCVNSLGAADGAALVRDKLNALRNEALKQRTTNLHQ